jgi:hypothetical protein
MPEWTEHLRPRLADLFLPPGREAEIVDELSQHLDDRYEELRHEGATDADARRLAMDELLDHDALASYMRPLRQSSAARPGVPGRSGLSWIGERVPGRLLLEPGEPAGHGRLRGTHHWLGRAALCWGIGSIRGVPFPPTTAVAYMTSAYPNG